MNHNDLYSDFEISASQRRVLYSEGNKACISLIIIKAGTVLDYEKLNKAFAVLIERHESLRTSFVEMEAGYVQRVYDSCDYRISDCRHADFHSIIDELSVSSIQPENFPLFGLSLCADEEGNSVVCFNKHMILSDKGGDEILVRELLQLYAGSEPEEVILQNIDFILWQNDLLTSDACRKFEEVWAPNYQGERFINYGRNRNMQSDKPGNVACQKFSLPEELLEMLPSEHGSQGIEMASLLYSAVLVFLYKYYATDDITLCYLHQGRNESLNTTVAYNDAFLPIRKILRSDTVFAELMASVKNSLNLLDKFPFYNQSGPTGKHHDYYLPNTGFQYISRDFRAISLDKYSISYNQECLQRCHGFFDLFFVFTTTSAELEIEVLYKTDVFDASDVKLIGTYFKEMLLSLKTTTSLSIRDINILSAEERHTLLFDFNNTHNDFDNSRPIGVRFEEIVALHPDRHAVICYGQNITYREFNERSNQIAHLLRSKGIGKGQTVGVYMERSIDLLVVMMGILKSGGIYVPFDRQHSSRRSQEAMNRSDLFALFVEYGDLEEKQEFLNEVKDLRYLISFRSVGYVKPELLVRISKSILDLKDVEEQQTSNPVNINLPSDPAYILYTSGSTGTPKGAIIHHEGKINHIVSEYLTLDLPDDFRFLQSASISSDISIWQFLGPLLKGGTVVIINQDDLLNYRKLLHIISTEKVAMIEFVASYLAELLSFLSEYPEARLPLGHLRYIMLVGEVLPVSLANKWLELFPHVPICHDYGPTEANDNVTQIVYKKPLSKLLKRLPIGKPLFNFNLFILDEDRNLLPMGAIGEICISGVGVGAGYYKDPERTAISFFENPFEGTLGKNIYRSGDLGRWLPDGTIDFIGRKDFQIKVRGFRVELGEIEAILRENARLSNVVVVQKEYKGEKVLIAYMLMKDSSTFSTAEQEDFIAEVRETLRRKLPEYMVPSGFMVLDKFPLTLSGKIDRKLLPDFTEESSSDAAVYKSPQTLTEQKLADIWREVLRKQEISRNVNFLNLGGHSLKATQIIARIFHVFGITITIKDFFMNPTIEGLAKIIEGPGEKKYPEIEQAAVQHYYEITNFQKRMFILEQREQSAGAYNMPGGFYLSGKADVHLLQKAMDWLVQRHESLRTVFEVVNGEPRQIVLDSSTLNSEIVYIDLLQQRLSEEQVLTVGMRESKCNFDLAVWPLFKLKLIRFEEEKSLFVFVIHHIVSDNWSNEIIWQEFLSVYNSFLLNQPVSMSPLEVQFKDFAFWQKQMFASRFGIDDQNYWLKKFSGEIPVLNLPADMPLEMGHSLKGDHCLIFLGEELTANFRKFNNEHGVTMFISLLSFLNILLAKHSGQDDIVVGTPVSGRYVKELEDQIGLYLDTIPLRNQIHRQDSISKFLSNVKTKALEAFDHPFYTYDMLLDELKLSPVPGRNPLFDVIIVMNISNAPIYFDNKQGGVSSEGSIDLERSISKLPLSFFFTDDANLVMDIEYKTDLFQPQTIQKLAEEFVAIVKLAVESPEISIEETINQLRDTAETLNGTINRDNLIGTLDEDF